jgi:hypothetical protein
VEQIRKSPLVNNPSHQNVIIRQRYSVQESIGSLILLAILILLGLLIVLKLGLGIVILVLGVEIGWLKWLKLAILVPVVRIL